MAATRILFVGNSLTYWRPGLDALFRGWGFDAAAVTEGGATLQVLWDAGTALKAIRSGQYGFVVLQDDMPEYGGAAAASKFQKYTRHFVEAVRESAAVPILLLTHSYDRIKHTRLHATAQRATPPSSTHYSDGGRTLADCTLVVYEMVFPAGHHNVLPIPR